MSGKKLVLVESPAKAKTIQRFVEKGTIVKATFGHIRDLPKSVLGVDVEHGFEPSYVIPKKASAVVKELKLLAKDAQEIYLATDPDREGEAIAWHVVEALKLDHKAVHRILFHEITNKAITHALENPTKINADLVDAQQARRVLDRLVGYSLSPLLWKKIYRGLSAGRVQSVALRLITDREAEIAAFKTTEYWSLWATFVTKKEDFLAKLEKIKGKTLDKYPTEEVIKAVMEYGEKEDWIVTDRIAEKKQRHPKPPFTTSTLQQDAGRKLHFSTKQTMMYAQKLYEGIAVAGETVGLITYMRTDSLTMAESALEEARGEIATQFGKNYVPAEPRRYKTKSKGAQEAHEAVRPTSFARTPASVQKYLTPEQYKLYKLIWERAIASQMASADVEMTQLQMGLKEKPTEVTYVARGVRILFPGFLKAYIEAKDEGSEEDAEAEAEDGEQFLPDVEKGDGVTLKGLEPKQHFTQPPPRYTEASLVKEMEKLGIGRPSTYSPTISTIIDRGYVVKEEGKFMPQEVGQIVIDLLKDKFPTIVDFQFTADMEEQLDDVADGGKVWQKVIEKFYGPFHKLIEAAGHDIEKKSLSEEKTDEVCPTCTKPLIIKLGRFGKFYACTGFPECKYTKPMGAEGDKAENQIEDRKCPQDGGALVIKSGRFGTFVACGNYPECKYIESVKKEIGILCPKDGGAIIERRSKRGKMFWGCGNYPKCDFVAWDKPVDQKCPTCNWVMVQKKDAVVCPQCTAKDKPEAGDKPAKAAKTTKAKKPTKSKK